MDREQEAVETYLRVFGWVLLAASLLPFDFYGNDPVWPWAGLLDGGWADRVAILFPLAAAAIFFWLARLRWHKVALAAAILGTLVLGWWVRFWSDLGPHALGVPII